MKPWTLKSLRTMAILQAHIHDAAWADARPPLAPPARCPHSSMGTPSASNPTLSDGSPSLSSPALEAYAFSILHMRPKTLEGDSRLCSGPPSSSSSATSTSTTASIAESDAAAPRRRNRHCTPPKPPRAQSSSPKMSAPLVQNHRVRRIFWATPRERLEGKI
ncbi:hypothetical protein C8J57DRAFT_1657847 [Mycena rebaudengoi]|nr:hypothetical protein C8J57DRAFT_1657847 [Mycena rebaudengoi]